jgi:serine protease Do
VRDSHKVGDAVEVIVERDGKEVTLTMEIGDSADY